MRIPVLLPFYTIPSPQNEQELLLEQKDTSWTWKFRGLVLSLLWLWSEQRLLRDVKPARGNIQKLLGYSTRDKLARETAAVANEFSFDADSDDEDAVHPAAWEGYSPFKGTLIFIDEKPLLQIIIEKAGHKCYSLPKFHCELNPIEVGWRFVSL